MKLNSVLEKNFKPSIKNPLKVIAQMSFSNIETNGRKLIFAISLLILLFFLSIFSVAIGAYQIEVSKVVSILFSKLGIDFFENYEEIDKTVLLSIRLPRVILAALIGSGLAISGASLQGLFRNSLADPGLIGISSGAAFAAVVLIVLNTSLPILGSFFGTFVISIGAFVGGLVATFIVYQLSLVNQRSVVTTMLLAGIAVNSLFGAGVGFMTFVADDSQLRSITFWMLGSLGGATWSTVSMTALGIIIPIIILTFVAKDLNAFVLGEAEAEHLGINTSFLKKIIIGLSAIIVGAAVSVSGIIGFVGLVVPHLVRLIIGSNHKFLLPCSALLGACLLILSDTFSRVFVAPAELPIGIVTSFLGAPFFIWLLVKDKKRNSLV